MTPNPSGVPLSRSLADIRAEQAGNLELLRSRLASVDPRDLVPLLVARHVLNTADMALVYSQEQPSDQLDKLICLLKTKNHWLGPLTDALIRNGHGSVAEELLKISSTRSSKIV